MSAKKKVARKQAPPAAASLVPRKIAPMVHVLRGEKVLLDADLASLYGVTTGNLNKAVKRNIGRFPVDFMFQVTPDELHGLHRSQTVTGSLTGSSLVFQTGSANARGGRRTLPYAFTEQGVAMLSSVLRSPRAVEVNIAIMRTFVQLRRLMDSNDLLAKKIETLEQRYDEQFAVVFDAIKRLIAHDRKPRREIGFHTVRKKP